LKALSETLDDAARLLSSLRRLPEAMVPRRLPATAFLAGNPVAFHGCFGYPYGLSKSKGEGGELTLESLSASEKELHRKHGK